MLGVVAVAPPLGVVAAGGVAVPPVGAGALGVAAGGVTAVPPVAAVPDDELLGAGVVEVVVVEVVVVAVGSLAGVVVPPDGGAVSAGVVSGAL